MGLKSTNSSLVPTRFLCLLAHLVILISIFIRREDYVSKCTEYSKPNTLDDQFIVALSLAIAFIVIEITSFMSGITLFDSFQLTLSTLCHSSGAVAVSCIIFYDLCSVDFWIIFALCSCIPLFTELILIFRIWCLKRTVN